MAATTFIPTITGRIIEITDGAIYATDWTIPEAIDRVSRLLSQADEYAAEAMLAAETSHADPAVFLAMGNDCLAQARALRAAVGKIVPVQAA